MSSEDVLLPAFFRYQKRVRYVQNKSIGTDSRRKAL